MARRQSIPVHADTRLKKRTAESGKTTGPARDRRAYRLRPAIVALLFPERVRGGAAEDVSGETMYAVTVEYKGRRELLYAGKRLPAHVSFHVPPFYCIDSADVALFAASAETDTGADPDEWIESHGNALLPAGFSSGLLHTAWRAGSGRVQAVSAVAAQLDERIIRFARRGYCVSCVPVLQGYANVWQDALPGRYLIWKVMKERSVLALVDDGAVVASCNFWAGFGDVENEDGNVWRDAGELAVSLSGGNTPGRMFVVPAAAEEVIRRQWSHDTISIGVPPDVPGCSAAAQEALGNTCTNLKNGLQLLPFEVRLHAEKMMKKIIMASAAVRGALALITVVTVVAAGYIGVSRIGLGADRTVMASLDADFAGMTAEIVKRDSLFKHVSLKTSYIAGESTVTNLLSALQTVFPEGAAAEEISLSERDGDSWNFSLKIFTLSAVQMNPVLQALERIPGISNVRTVYSEQADSKQGPSGIRFRVEAVWK